MIAQVSTEKNTVSKFLSKPITRKKLIFIKRYQVF